MLQHDRIVLCFCAGIGILCTELLELLWNDHGAVAQFLNARCSRNASKLIAYALKWLEEVFCCQHYLTMKLIMCTIVVQLAAAARNSRRRRSERSRLGSKGQN